MSKSKFFESDQVRGDLENIFSVYQEIANKTSQLSSMSADQRLNHIAECKALIDKQLTFYTRLSLASFEDPEASDMKQRINALCNAFGYRDLPHCMDSMQETLDKAAQREIDRP